MFTFPYFNYHPTKKSKMGADGGSIPDRSDMVKTKARSKITDKDVLREIFFLCALSKVRPFISPTGV